MSDVKYLVKFGGMTFRPARKAPKILGRISGQISAKFSETPFQISRLFFWKLRSAEGGKFCRKFLREFSGFFRTHNIKGQKIGENFGAFFVGNFVV